MYLRKAIFHWSVYTKNKTAIEVSPWYLPKTPRMLHSPAPYRILPTPADFEWAVKWWSGYPLHPPHWLQQMNPVSDPWTWWCSISHPVDQPLLKAYPLFWSWCALALRPFPSRLGVAEKEAKQFVSRNAIEICLHYNSLITTINQFNECTNLVGYHRCIPWRNRPWEGRGIGSALDRSRRQRMATSRRFLHHFRCRGAFRGCVKRIELPLNLLGGWHCGHGGGLAQWHNVTAKRILLVQALEFFAATRGLFFWQPGNNQWTIACMHISLHDQYCCRISSSHSRFARTALFLLIAVILRSVQSLKTHKKAEAI